LGAIPWLLAQPSSYGHLSSLSSGAAVLGNTLAGDSRIEIADSRQHALFGPQTNMLYGSTGMFRK
jgi:hypothetical protein